MKSIYFFIRKIFFICIFLCLGSLSAFSQEDGHIPEQKSLEVSLIGLQESAYKAKEKNKWLISESQKLRRSISFLQEKLEILEREKSRVLNRKKQLEGPLQKAENESLVVKKNFDALNKNFLDLNRKHSRLKKKIEIKKKKGKGVQDKLEKIRNDIIELERKISLKEDTAQISLEEMQIEELKKNIKLSENNIVKVEKRMQQVQSKYAKPSEMMESLVERNKILEQRVEIVSDELGQVKEEELHILQSIENLKKEHDIQHQQIVKMVLDLNLQSQNLGKILEKAKQKLQKKKLSLDGGIKKNTRLKEGLQVIRKENKILKNKFNLLKNKVKYLEQK